MRDGGSERDGKQGLEREVERVSRTGSFLFLFVSVFVREMANLQRFTPLCLFSIYSFFNNNKKYSKPN